MFKWAIMIRFRLFLCIWLNASIFSVSSEEVSFARFMADWSDFSVFPKLVKDLKFIWESKLKALWKLLVTHQVVANFLIHLIKLIATLPKPLGFKCNPSSFSSFEVIFPLSIILYYKVVVIVNKRTPPPLSLQRMQLIAASVRTFRLNRHHGVFQELLLNFHWTFFWHSNWEKHFYAKLHGSRNISKEYHLREFQEDLHCNKLENVFVEKYQILQVLLLNQFLIRSF